MPARDPIAVLARLRGMARDAARRDMASALAGVVAAEAAESAAAAMLRRESGAAPADFAAWLPAAHRARDQAAMARQRAEAEFTAAREALVVARAEAEAVEATLAARRAARRRARLAAEQRLLDDLPR